MVLEHLPPPAPAALLPREPALCQGSSAQGSGSRSSSGLALGLHPWHGACHAISLIIPLFSSAENSSDKLLLSGKPETLRADSLWEHSWSHTLVCRAPPCHIYIYKEAICMSLSAFILEVCSVAVFQHKLWALWFGKVTSRTRLDSVLVQCHLTADCPNPQTSSENSIGKRNNTCWSGCGAR